MLDRLLDRRISVTMITLVLVVLGCIGIGRLPVSLIPDVDIPYITVRIADNSLSARELDNTVVRTLRQNFVQMANLKDIRSEARDGVATMLLSFEEGSNIDYCYIEVNEKIDRSISSLPRIRRPEVFKASATDIPAFYINMTLEEGGGHTEEAFLELSDFARDVIVRRLEQLPEVAMVDMSGYAEREILIVPGSEAVHQLGITPDEFQQQIQSANVNLSSLSVRDGEYRYSVNFRSFSRTKEDIENICFNVGGRVLRLKDMARVEEIPAGRMCVDLSNGSEAVVMAVVKQQNARMSDLKESVTTLMESFREDYPGVGFEITRDQTELLDYSISSLLQNIIIAIILSCLVIFMFMKDMKSALLVSLTIPVSLVISFLIFYLAGISINILSLSGLILGVGMMVDNSIIVTDNITARWVGGEKLRHAVVAGTMEVLGPMLSSVLTTCAVFIPLIFLNGLTGDLFYDQAMSITIVLLTSYLVTIFILPIYYWALYRGQPSFRPSRLLARFSLPLATAFYDTTVELFIRKRRLAWLLPLLCVAVSLLAAAFMDKEKLPPMTADDAVLSIDWNDHIALEENRRRVAVLEETIRSSVEQSTALIGIQQFALSGTSGNESLESASLYFKCAGSSRLEDVRRMLARKLADDYPDAVYEFTAADNIFTLTFASREAPLVARLSPSAGNGLELTGVEKGLEAIRAELPGLSLDSPATRTDIVCTAMPEAMNLYGVSYQSIAAALTNSLNSNELFSISSGERNTPVILGTDAGNLQDILAGTFIDTRKASMPLGTFVRQNFSQDFKMLVSGKEGPYYPVTIDKGGYSERECMSGIRRAVARTGEFNVDFSGTYFSNTALLRQMLLLLSIAVLILYLILASQFESLVQPVIILSEVVIDIAVCLLVVWLAGLSINVMTLIGLIVICGIVINDSILKISTINRLRKEGLELGSAIHEAGHRRLKAIVMTSLTTILSVLPFLSGGSAGDDLQFPMALVIVVGMTVGTLVSLFYVPGLYNAIYRRRQ